MRNGPIAFGGGKNDLNERKNSPYEFFTTARGKKIATRKIQSACIAFTASRRKISYGHGASFTAREQASLSHSRGSGNPGFFKFSILQQPYSLRPIGSRGAEDKSRRDKTRNKNRSLKQPGRYRGQHPSYRQAGDQLRHVEKIWQLRRRRLTERMPQHAGRK